MVQHVGSGFISWFCGSLAMRPYGTSYELHTLSKFLDWSKNGDDYDYDSIRDYCEV